MPSQMSQDQRARLLKLAQERTPLRAIAERLGLGIDQTRRAIQRAIERGEVPIDTLARCGVKTKSVQR